MKLKYKIIVLLIAFTLLITPMNSLAAISSGAFPDSAESPQSEAIAFLRAFEILLGDGDTGLYRPNDNLTRQEFAVIISRISALMAPGDPIPGIDITINQGGSTSFVLPYSDAATIAVWAQDAVALMHEKGWFKGYEDGSFRPRNNLNFAEALTVLLRILGYEQTMEDLNWPDAYVAKAYEFGLSKRVFAAARTPITREDMAQLTYNALFIPQILKEDDSFVSTAAIMDSKKEKENPAGYIKQVIFLDLDESAALTYVHDDIQPSPPTLYWQNALDLYHTADQLRKKDKKTIFDKESAGMAADLKALADELVNILISTDGNSNSNSNANPIQLAADLKALADELVNILISTDGNSNSNSNSNNNANPIQLAADLKKLADELVNVYSFSERTILLGAMPDRLMGISGKLVFDKDDNLMVILLEYTK